MDAINKITQTFVEITNAMDVCLIPDFLQSMRTAFLGDDLDLMFITNITAQYSKFKTNLSNIFTFDLDLFCYSSAAVVGQILGFHSV